MPFSDIVSSTADAVRSAGTHLTDLLTPRIRLGVTGLARSGKTVFIAALVRNLVSGGRMPFFRPYAEGRILRAYLEPQADDAVPRFDYEQHLARLASDPPEWPHSTRHISELRVTIEFLPSRTWRRALGPSRLHLDIVDYPGEWLGDLALLSQGFAEWSSEALALASAPQRFAAAQQFQSFLSAPDLATLEEETCARDGAKAFTHYLHQVRGDERAQSGLGPGRFLMPGDLEGSPLLTFFPLPAPLAASRPKLAALLARRFESYKSHVARPFFRDHFSRLDRQIVLIDVLGALNGGAPALQDLDHAMDGILRAFRPGANGWLATLQGRRVDHLLFAATKADHLHHTSHDKLEAILRLLTARAFERARHAGADAGTLALASLRATKEGTANTGTETLPCIVGVPLPGQRIGGTVFDGKTEAAVFPGDLPSDPRIALAAAQTTGAGLCVVRFRPPRLDLTAVPDDARPLANIRLDRALDFLLGDLLA